MVRLQTVPSTDGVLGEGGCDPYFVVRCLRRSGNGWTSHKLFDQFKGGGKIRKRHAADRFATLDPLEPVSIRGDVNVAVYDYEWGGKNTKICGAWLDAARERARSPSERPRRAPRRRRDPQRPRELFLSTVELRPLRLVRPRVAPPIRPPKAP